MVCFPLGLSLPALPVSIKAADGWRGTSAGTGHQLFGGDRTGLMPLLQKDEKKIRIGIKVGTVNPVF